ncbi:MAG: hypothetical protein HC875_20685 [Anaerolineales bacterium]|nr:hypothetical protein [Anaerolineales bacterium]
MTEKLYSIVVATPHFDNRDAISYYSFQRSEPMEWEKVLETIEDYNFDGEIFYQIMFEPTQRLIEFPKGASAYASLDFPGLWF